MILFGAVENSYSKIHSTVGSWPVRGGVDPPSSRDPPHLASGTAPHHQPNLSAFRPASAGRTLSGPSAYGDMDAGRFVDYTTMSREPEFMDQDYARGSGKAQSAKRVPMSFQKYNNTRSANGEYDEPKQAKRIPKPEAIWTEPFPIAICMQYLRIRGPFSDKQYQGGRQEVLGVAWRKPYQLSS